MPAPLCKVVAYVRRLADVDAHQLTDRQLLERFRCAGDEPAFAELVRRHGPMVLATCRRVLRHEQDAEDAFQAAFLVLARKAASIRQHDSIGGWLHQVAHRLALRARSLGDRRADRFTPIVGDPPAPATDAKHESLGGLLDQELAQLPESYRAAIVLCYFEGKTQSQAARLLATTTDAVNSRLKRARDLLRQRLVRQGLTLSAGGLVSALAADAQAALPTPLLAQTARVALLFMAEETTVAVGSAAAVALAKGVLPNMIPAKLKVASVVAVALIALAFGAMWMPSHAQDDPPLPLANVGQAPRAPVAQPTPKEKPGKKRCIILWMDGGPSQIDTFDPKAGNIALFKAIDTSVKGVQFSETLPLLAKQAHHLAVLRGVSTREGDHQRGAHWMRTGYAPGGIAYPDFASVLAKELGDDGRKTPRLVTINPIWINTPGRGPGFLGAKYAPLLVGHVGFGNPRNADLTLPPVEAFEKLDKDKGAAMRKAVEKAFDLDAEPAKTRDAYGQGSFGSGCLLARRLLEAGVPVVEVVLGGWDTHANAAAGTKTACGELDPAMAALLKDLEDRKLLDNTLIVWMGEFGRTPRVNGSGGRDHWPMSFSAVLAGAGVKGGQVIGKTSADALKIEERAVSPQELLATIYKAVDIDATTVNVTAGGDRIPLVERGNNAVKEALR
jgi:RNA polymerase sigma factor (sigma-70 family)